MRTAPAKISPARNRRGDSTSVTHALGPNPHTKGALADPTTRTPPKRNAWRKKNQEPLDPQGGQRNTTAKLELESGAFLRSSAASSALARITLAGGRARLPALTAHWNDAHGTKHGKAHRRERTRVPEPAPGPIAFPGNKSRKPTKTNLEPRHQKCPPSPLPPPHAAPLGRTRDPRPAIGNNIENVSPPSGKPGAT